MRKSRWEKAKGIFARVVALDNSVARRQYIERVCHGDESLKAEVEFLLDNHRKSGGFMEVPSSLSGKMLLKRYRILAQFPQSMSCVCVARDSRLNRIVVVKYLPAWANDDINRKARLLREAQCLAAIDHPNIVRIYDFSTEDGREFIVTEFVPGETLREKIAAGPIALKDALQYALQIGSGLVEAHKRGIIHRDLKPSNIVITPEGTVKVLDLGLAKIVTEELPIQGNGFLLEPRTLEGDILGTAGYMSPEQAAGKSADHRSDIWGLGILLYEMLVGHRAFNASSGVLPIDLIRTIRPAELPSTIPPPVAKLVWRCLEPQPERRYQSVREILPILKGSLAEASDGDNPGGLSKIGSPLPKKKTSRAIALGSLALVGAALGWHQSRNGK